MIEAAPPLAPRLSVFTLVSKFQRLPHRCGWNVIASPTLSHPLLVNICPDNMICICILFFLRLTLITVYRYYT